MPKGPFGFPRLTNLGPLVEPSEIVPNHDTASGEYGLDDIRQRQNMTARDTLMFLTEGDHSLEQHIEGVPVFEYKQVSLGRLISSSEFSAGLMEYAESNPDEIKRLVIEGEIEDSDIEDLCLRFQNDKGGRARKECANKIKNDIERVQEINNEIRDTSIYFPPTIFPISSNRGDTIDGAHRIVALASILGTEEHIYVWELKNTEEIYDIKEDLRGF